MVTARQRHRELIADLTPECPALRETQVMGIRRSSTANQTSMLGNGFDMIPVSNPARLWQRQDTFIDPFRSRPVLWFSLILTVWRLKLRLRPLRRLRSTRREGC
jgi:hypothetical protein